MLPLHRATSAASLAASERAQKRWDLLRMHFLEFPDHSRRLTRQKWHSLVDTTLERSRELKHRHQVRIPQVICITSALHQYSVLCEVNTMNRLLAIVQELSLESPNEMQGSTL